MSELVLYNEMCSAIAKCAAIDEVAGIKDKAEQLEAYARVRDDSDAQRKFAEIRLRACMRIGEISRELETVERKRDESGRLLPNDGKQGKTGQLAAAGISTSTAQRYEELAGGKEKQAQHVAVAAAETYFATQETNKEPVSMGGLKSAVREALTKSFGEPAKKERQQKREPDLLVHFLYSANWAIEKRNFEPPKLAAEVMEDFAQDEIDSCRFFIPLLEKFIQELKTRFNHVK